MRLFSQNSTKKVKVEKFRKVFERKLLLYFVLMFNELQRKVKVLSENPTPYNIAGGSAKYFFKILCKLLLFTLNYLINTILSSKSLKNEVLLSCCKLLNIK